MKTDTKHTPENPPAFPTHNGLTHDNEPHGGMSLRDYFAGQALIGCCSNPRFVQEVRNFTMDDAAEGHAVTAKSAYRIADAMLDARAIGKEGV